MNPVIFVVVDAATFATVQTNDAKLAQSAIQNYVPMKGYVSYITEDLTPPPGALYVSKMNGDKSQVVMTTKSAAYTPAMTFFGWPVPA